MKVCVVGFGAREHALALACARSAEVILSPGLVAMQGRSLEGHRVTTSPAPPREIDADLFVVGPEGPLVAGLADELRSIGRLVFGPGADGAALEGSKAFMKEVVASARVPSARYECVTSLDEARTFFADEHDGPYVVKTDGLAGGKGVLVTADLAEALRDVEEKLSGRAFGSAGARVVLEEAMAGPELSLLVLTDGTRAVALPVAQDFKRLGDGDDGPNTGGMGAYSPVPLGTDELVDDVMAAIIEPTLAELRRRSITYRGVLYAGLMVTETGPKLVEYNVRFGDPETQAVLPRLDGDITALLAEVAQGMARAPEAVRELATVATVLAAPGYPQRPRLGDRLRGCERAGTVEGVTVLHGGTAIDDAGELVSAGGRVLTVVGTGPDLATARQRSYEAIGHVELDGGHYRRDIAAHAAATHVTDAEAGAAGATAVDTEKALRS